MILSSPRAESARVVTGRRCSHSGVEEDFVAHLLVCFTKTRKRCHWFPDMRLPNSILHPPQKNGLWFKNGQILAFLAHLVYWQTKKQCKQGSPCGFSVMWVPKHLLPPAKVRNFWWLWHGLYLTRHLFALSFKMQGDIISDQLLMLSFQKDSLDTVDFSTQFCLDFQAFLKFCDLKNLNSDS